MYEGTVQAVSQRCTTCGSGPVSPRVSSYHDRQRQETVTEATWVCGSCGSRFASGIVGRDPDVR